MRRKSSLAGIIFRHGLPVFLVAVFLLPLAWLIASSLQRPGVVPPDTLSLWPYPVSWSNYARVFQDYPIGGALINSLLIVCIAVPLTLLTASWAGFAMAGLPPRTRRRLVTLTVMLMIIPIPVLWLPRFIMYTWVGLNDNLLTLLLPALMGSSPFFVLLFYWTFRRVPSDLFESARLDGAGTLRLWWGIAVPLARPTTAVVSVLAFALYWSDYLSPLVFLRSESLYTYSLRLQMFTAQNPADQPLAMSAAVIAIVPVVVLFLLVQRYYWPEGRTGGLSGR